jgi:DNA polymerase I-like protein with 3'-5' exonuclease and polymerase domains
LDAPVKYPTTVDVETFRIEGRPDYPPIPVGVAVKRWGHLAQYHGFGHVVPEDGRLELVTAHRWNNSTGVEAMKAIQEAYANPDGVLFHNAKFDLDVIETHFGIKPPPWDRIHDTMFLLFLEDPNQKAIGLKPAAERLLGVPPEERDVLADWLHKHQPVPGVRVGKAPGGKHPPGAYIAYAPSDIVGPYAIGDVVRTEKLFDLLYPTTMEGGLGPTYIKKHPGYPGAPDPNEPYPDIPSMGPAYDRERKLLLVLLDMERRGVAIDLPRLQRDILRYTEVLAHLETWVRKFIGADPSVNLDSGPQLIAALDRAGMVDVAKLGKTPTGKPSSAKGAIDAAVTDRQLAATLRYIGALRTCLSTFMLPWERTARASGGLVYTSWNQTRGNGGGARTGRLSSSPNFQNIPTEFDSLFGPDPLPDPPFGGMPDLPLCRTYITAYPGQTLIGRDYASQELRILAHYENSTMLNRYEEDPDADIHQYAADLISEKTGKAVTRKVAKAIDFGIVYGSGATGLSRTLKCDKAEAKDLLDAFRDSFPGVVDLQRDLTFRANTGKPIHTIGGRRYFCEEEFIPTPGADGAGETVTFPYKLVNTLVQGSAADQTKDAMIAIHEAAGPGKLILSVHDEIVLSVPPDTVDTDMALLATIMNTSPLITPMRSEGETGTNWAEMVKHD